MVPRIVAVAVVFVTGGWMVERFVSLFQASSFALVGLFLMSMAYVSLAAVPLSTIGLFDLLAGSTLPVFAGVLTRIAGVLLGGGMGFFQEELFIFGLGCFLFLVLPLPH